MGFPFLVMMSHLRHPGSSLAVEEKHQITHPLEKSVSGYLFMHVLFLTELRSMIVHAIIMQA